MTHDRLDFFIERLLFHLENKRQLMLSEDIIKLAQYDLGKEDLRQEVIEAQAYNDAFDHLKYGAEE